MSDEHEPTTRSFRPGEWFGIFGEHVSVILPPSEKARVAALWEMVDDGAGFDEALDALIATGLRDLPSFVLVSEVSGETRVVLRGAARARFTTAEETVDLDGSVATTWVERSLRDVTRMSVELAEDAGSEDLHLAGGLVRLSRVDQPPRSAEPEAVAPEAVAPPQVVEQPDTEPEPAPVPAPVPDREPEPEAVPWYSDLDEPTEAVPLLADGPWAEPEARPGAEQPVQASEEQALEEQPDQDVSVEDDSVEDYYEEPPIWVPRSEIPPYGPPVLPPPPPSPPAPPAPPVLADGAVDSPDEAERPAARLVFSSGETVEVDGALLVGRAPEARRLTTGEEPRLVTVPSPHQEISSTHLEIRPGSGADHGSAVVTDLGSTNGTVLVEPGRTPEELQPGIAVRLVDGAVLDLGDGVTIQVSQA